LQRRAEIVADQRGEPVRLTFNREHRALDLLVMLELHLEERIELDADARSPAMPTKEYGSAACTFSMSRLAMRLPIVARRSPAMMTPSA
jgi:hypothetical protein